MIMLLWLALKNEMTAKDTALLAVEAAIETIILYYFLGG